MTAAVLGLYRELALGGVGLIITGGFPVAEVDVSNECKLLTYEDVRITGTDQLAEAIHSTNRDCKAVAQIETGYLAAGPSEITSPFLEEPIPELSREMIEKVIESFVACIVQMKADGFDGVQLHAAHGGILSCFLSPYSNRRDDAYGGSEAKRARIVREIVSRARERVGNFPILIKVNATDYVEGGIDIDTFPALAVELQRIGIDAIEVSGGMWECLVRDEAELGFRPVPAPESHTRINQPEKQSYFLEYAERLDLQIPVILVGGNRDADRLEAILQTGKVDFVALCRPLIHEPDLPNRWREGHGSSATGCISCNACIHDLIAHPGQETPGPVRCVFKEDKEQYEVAMAWLATWVEKNTIHRDEVP
jgi:2,4-dienoyl-CoA reductase-like NADH-dependent reductase (Old Yellow Enzyme family)